jgi:hypothetical protein
MNRLLLSLLLACACAGTHATTIKAYETRLDVTADGAARATVNVTLADSQPGRIRLPMGFAAISDFQVLDAPQEVFLKPVATKDQSTIEVELPQGVTDKVTLTFGFIVPDILGRPSEAPGEKSKLPSDTRLLKHVLVNTQPMPIGSYRIEVRLPEDVRIHKIGEQLPKPKRSEILPRVQLDRIDGRQSAVLQFANIKQGDRTSMSLDVVESRVSPMWLLVGLVLSAGYLVAFRDLVKPAQA